MDGGQKQRRLRAAPGAPLRVSGLALAVVSRLAARTATERRSLRLDLLDKLVSASLSADAGAMAAVLPEFRRARITAAMITDHYIPEAARKLGRGWADDCMSFAEVTVGSARLQMLVRDIGAGWAADGRGKVDGATVLVLVPGHEQHTLGATVLTSDLRRRGVSVCLRMQPDEPELRTLVRTRQFDGIMISHATSACGAEVARLIALLRKSAPQPLTIAVGGAAVLEGADTTAFRGADLISNDLDAVLALFAPLERLLAARETIEL